MFLFLVTFFSLTIPIIEIDCLELEILFIEIKLLSSGRS
jgi:hypothetical protein